MTMTARERVNKRSMEVLLERHSENPIITPADMPGAYAVINPGQTMFEGRTLLLLPVAHNAGENGPLDQDITAHVALSDDGVHFDINPAPLFRLTTTGPIGAVREQCVDFRITKIDDAYYVIHPGCGPWGTLGILGKTTDWKTFENVDIVSRPDNRMPCLLSAVIAACQWNA